MALILEDESINAEANALTPLCNDGYLRIKTVADLLLAELRFAVTSFGAASAGVITANAIAAVNAAATGAAGKYEAYKSNGTSKLWTGAAGTSGTELILNSVDIQSGAQVSVTSFIHTVPKSV
jgi:hypothetical protein